MKLPVALIFVLLVLCSAVRATTFTVTSNADSGPGTLREAMQAAADNGSGVPDLIVFNLPGTLRSDRTILLLSNLPLLSSSLVIDGTTQAGAPFGISNARVQIQNDPSFYGLFYCFQALQVSNIAIYGLYLWGAPNTNSGNGAYALQFREASNIRFGAAGKGNIISGFAQAFDSDLQSVNQPGSSDITIQGNLLGIDETGTMPGPTGSNSVTFYLLNVANLQIGGLNPGEGNLICESGYAMQFTCTRPDAFGYLRIQGNKIGTDKTGLIKLDPVNGSFQISGYNNGVANVTGTTAIDIEITNNISTESFTFFQIKNYFKIKGNYIGVGPDGVTNIYGGAGAALIFEFCGQGIIGGANAGDKNYIANAPGAGVFEFWCSNITISQNSIFCNIYGIDYNWLLTRPAPFVTINTLTAGSVGGTANPNSTVELFYDDACPGCEGKTYIGTTTADNSGNWTYSVTLTGAVVATATDTYGATSPFSTATLNTAKVVVQDATCGKFNGSIKNIAVISGTEWHWNDAAGNQVGTDTDLVNVGPGSYVFVTSIGGNACLTATFPYVIKNVDPPAFDPGKISVTQPGCGQNNGVVQYQGSFDASANYEWQDATGSVLVPDWSVVNPLKGVPPGSYTLLVALKQDPTCYMKYGVYTLVNQSGPTLNTAPVQVVSSTCGKSNGALTNITAQGAVGPLYVAWKNAAGVIVGNSMDLVNVPAGDYRLYFKDGGNCDTIITSVFTIPDIGGISYDDRQMVIRPVSCQGNDGAITGIQSTNATIFEWVDAATGITVGGTEDLTHVPAGGYHLVMTNGLGCRTSTEIIVIGQHLYQDQSVLDAGTVNANCDLDNGTVHINKYSADPSLFSFQWIDSSTHAVLSQTDMVSGLAPGLYALYATDINGCTQRVYTATIVQEGIPVAPVVSDQTIPRNTATVVAVANPQTGSYDLLDSELPGAAVLATSTSGVLTTPVIAADRSFFVGFSKDGCMSPLSKVNIKVFDSTMIFVPNAFSPNNNGANDRWHIIVRGRVKVFNVSVFDRWGMKVFSSSNTDVYWDGMLGGKILSGAFAYLITGTDYFNQPIKLRGTVLIIR